VEGLGSRRGEGFGRVRVDDPLVKSPAEVRKAKQARRAPAPDATVPPPSDAAKAFLRTIERQAVSNAIQLAAEIRTSDAADREALLGWRRDAPSMSQLGALRSVMNGLAHRDDRRRTIDFLESLRGSDREQRWGGPATIGKLIDLFEQPDAVWRALDLHEETGLLGAAAVSTPAALRTEYADPALASFLAAAMRAHKRDLEKD
jgi:CRISPR-associated protein Csx10